jgi:hypothetical protein
VAFSDINAIVQTIVFSALAIFFAGCARRQQERKNDCSKDKNKESFHYKLFSG